MGMITASVVSIDHSARVWATELRVVGGGLGIGCCLGG
jgi:hypothetical protein